MRIDNALQTNGTKLDAAWSKFLKANNFLVGISLDGPKELHDRYRKTKGGRGSFDQVKRGLDALLDEGAEFNVLTVVQRHNGDHPIKVFDGLKALGATHIQFIPIVEPTGRGKVSPRTVLPEQFGAFLIEVFEKWRGGGNGFIFRPGPYIPLRRAPRGLGEEAGGAGLFNKNRKLGRLSWVVCEGDA